MINELVRELMRAHERLAAVECIPDQVRFDSDFDESFKHGKRERLDQKQFDHGHTDGDFA